MYLLMWFQAAQDAPPPAQTLPVTIEGAAILILMGLVPVAPRIWSALAKGIELFVGRMGTKSEATIQGSSTFQLLSEEVKALRAERAQDWARITEAENEAREAMKRADKFEADLRTVQNELSLLRRERDAAQGAIAARDERIAKMDERYATLLKSWWELTSENQRLRRLLATHAPNVTIDEGI